LPVVWSPARVYASFPTLSHLLPTVGFGGEDTWRYQIELVATLGEGGTPGRPHRLIGFTNKALNPFSLSGLIGEC
jgi:hypothetical protein